MNLDGVILPLPNKAKGFKMPEGVTDWKWRQMKEEVWERAYLHCLYSLPLHFELPLHSVVPRLARKMLEASDPFNVALRFMGEMELAGYIKLDRGMDERIVIPTKKFLKLELNCERAPDSAITMPKLRKEDIPNAPIRGGIASDVNKEVTKITFDMSMEKFEINKFIFDLLKDFPPEFDKPSSGYMYGRAMQCAEEFLDKEFYFQMFLDSRSRMYTDTTCGFSPQGADHEKALCIPIYKEVLTTSGFDALVESAYGYSEIEWTVEEMANMARHPKETSDVWFKSDKPYSFMACANLIRMYLDNPELPLPAFIPLDGRCSGLQHWSAVVRSNAITRHLGMHEDEDKLDIYEKVAEDWKATLDPEWHFLATRKAAKIPVMTWGYNATMMTAMNWIDKLFGAKRVWDKELSEFKVVGDGLERAVTGSKGADLYRRLNKTLKPLRAAVDWVSDCAVSISCYGNVDIRWPTPDGFEAVQRKVKGEKRDLECVISDGSRFTLDILDFSGEIPNTAKHRSAIAPNIIHSLDATHLRMVARRLSELNLPMIFIHDSFATHCNHREALYEIIIDTFIDLYSGNYLVELKEYWEKVYGVELEAPPTFGSWEPQSLRGLQRFFL